MAPGPGPGPWARPRAAGLGSDRAALGPGSEPRVGALPFPTPTQSGGGMQGTKVFSGYHAVRRHFKTINQFCEFNRHELSSAQLCCARGVFADAFMVEARELYIYVCKFSLPSFLAFISAN